MSHSEDYDLVVLGSGRGRFLAWSMASEGKRTAVVERRYVTGSCPSIACLPSKIPDPRRQGRQLLPQGCRVRDRRRAIGRSRCPPSSDGKRKMVDGMVVRNHELYRESGAELVMGQGRFVGPRTIEVVAADGGTRTLRGEVVVISTGSRARIDPIPGLAEARPMTHVEALDLDRVPGHLVVLGGGYVGLELAQAFRRFGSRVTVIERNDALAHREDRDVSEALRELFEDEGIEVRTGIRVERVEGRSGESVKLHVARDGAEDPIEGTDLLVASGRTPNTDGIDLEAAGSSGTTVASSRSTSGAGRRPPGYGRWAIARVAPSSPTWPTTTSAWSATISPASTGRRPDVWYPSACSPTPSWPGSA